MSTGMGNGPLNNLMRILFDHRRDDIRSILGAGDHLIADADDGDFVVPSGSQNCRYFEADTEGIIKITYADDAGNTRTRVVTARKGPNLYPNIRKVFNQYKAGSECTAAVYNDAGASRVGIALIY